MPQRPVPIVNDRRQMGDTHCADDGAQLLGHARTLVPSPPHESTVRVSASPDEHSDAGRTYANFCAVNHTPFDFTLTFCEMAPLSEKDIRAAESEHVVRAAVKSRVVLPVQVIPTLIAALQEQMRIYTESAGNAGAGPVH